MKTRLLLKLLGVCLCSTLYGGEIEVSIEPTSNLLSIIESGFKMPNDTDVTPESVDLFVCIRNTSTNSLLFFEEWNSWGFENLKFVCDNGWHEYWIVKRPGSWPRNFPASREIAPGKGFIIPVTLDTNIWAGITEAQADTHATHIRALYEQITSPTNPPPYYPGRHWNGSQSSKYYRMDKILSQNEHRKNSNKFLQRTR